MCDFFFYKNIFIIYSVLRGESIADTQCSVYHLLGNLKKNLQSIVLEIIIYRFRFVLTNQNYKTKLFVSMYIRVNLSFWSGTFSFKNGKK